MPRKIRKDVLSGPQRVRGGARIGKKGKSKIRGIGVICASRAKHKIVLKRQKGDSTDVCLILNLFVFPFLILQ